MYEDEESIYRLDDKERVNLFLQVLANPALYSSFDKRELFVMKMTVIRFTKGQINQLKMFYEAYKETIVNQETSEFRQRDKY